MVVSALEAGWSDTTGTGGSSPSHSHSAVAGSNRVLVAFVYWEHTGTDRVLSTLTAGGQSLTEQEAFQAGASQLRGVKLWSMNEAAVAAMSGGSFVFGWASTIPDAYITIYTRYFENIDQAVNWAGTDGDSIVANPSAVGTQWASSVAHDDGDMGVYGAVKHTGQTAPTATQPSGWTENYDDLPNHDNVAGGIRALSGSGTVQPTVFFTTTGSQPMASAGGVLNVVAAGGGGDRTRALLDVRADLNQSGGFTGTGEDLSGDGYVLMPPNGPGVHIKRGNDVSQPTLPIKIGEATFDLDNQDGNWDVDTRDLDEGDPIRIQANHSSVDYPLFEGPVEALTEHPEWARQSVSVRALGPGGAFARRKNYKSELQTGVRIDQAIGTLLDAVGWPSADRVLDVADRSCEFFWLDVEDDPWKILSQLVNAEGPLAQFYMDGQGRAVFEAQNFRTTATRSTVIQETFRRVTTEPIFSRMLKYDNGQKAVVNKAAISWQKLAAQVAEPEVIFSEWVLDQDASTAHTFKVPSVVKAGDVVLINICASAFGGTNTFTPPSGWDVIHNFSPGPSDKLIGGVWSRRIESDDEAGGTVAYVTNLANQLQYSIIAVRGLGEAGADITAIEHATAQSNSGAAQTQTAQITTTIAKTFLIHSGGGHNVNGLGIPFSSTPTDATVVGQGSGTVTGSFFQGTAIAYETKTATITNENNGWTHGGTADDMYASTVAYEWSEEREVWSAGEQLSLANSEVLALTAESDLPVTGAIAPVEGLDFAVTSGSSPTSIVLDQTSGTSIKITITAAGTGGPHLLDGAAVASAPLGLRMRAIPHTVIASGKAEDGDATSQGLYQERGLKSYATWPFMAKADAQGNAEDVIAALKDPRPLVIFEVWPDRDDQTLTDVLGLEISDAVRFIGRAGIDINYGWVEHLDYLFGQGSALRALITIKQKTA